MTAKLFIKTHGCQMNEYDSDRMADLLKESHALTATDVPDDAEVILVNTCSIREKAQEKVFSELLKLLNSEDEINSNMLPIDSDMLNKINKFASVKHISKNIQRDENKLEEIFNEMKKDLKNLFLEKKISQLESKFSKNMDENTFKEIKELKKLQNNN